MVGPNQYRIVAANNSNGNISYDQTVGWCVNGMGHTISMLLSSGFIYPIPHKRILLSLKRGLNSTPKLFHFTFMSLQFPSSFVLHLISITAINNWFVAFLL